MIAVSSKVLPPRDRFDFWCDLINRQFGPMRTERVADRAFHGDIRAQMVGDVPVTDILNGGTRSSRRRLEIARTRDHCYFVAVHLDGAACFASRDEHIVLRRGDIFFGDTMHEFGVDLQQKARQLVVKLPTPWIESRVARPDSLANTVLHDHPLSPLLAGYITNGFQMAEQLSPAAATMFAQHVVELTAQAIEEAPGSQPTPSKAWRAALFVRASQLIALRFGEPALTPECIARSLGVSTRLLQRIFAEHDATVMARVWEERVRHAAGLLAAPAAAHRSITEIAFACGFNDSAHFTRAFVARMATTPSHWRCEALERALDGDTAARVNDGRKQSIPRTGTSVQLR